MTPLDVLIAARALLARPHGWTKNNWHKVIRRDGKKIDCYCADGAIRAVLMGQDDPTRDNLSNAEALHRDLYYPAAKALGFAMDPLCGGRYYVVPYNDASTTKKADVLAAYDRAIEALQPEET